MVKTNSSVYTDEPSSMPQLWIVSTTETISNDPVYPNNVKYINRLDVKDLGWTFLETFETRVKLQSFEEDWNSPGMEAYDEL